MKYVVLSVVFALVSHPALALFAVGEVPTNYCWQDVDDNKVCLEDFCHVRVLMYNAGWCGPCNEKFSEVVASTNEFNGKPVTFISLSAAGWSSASKPDKKFLQEWRAKHKLDRGLANIVVAASHRDAGRDFFPSPSIPNVVIIDTSGEVAYKAEGPSMKTVLEQVRRLLPVPVPIPAKLPAP
jgi:peroxiredoxin